jgi:solute:Na+ symporter, SSS family
MLPLATTEVNFWTGLAIVAYLVLTVYLGWLGYIRTKTAADYLIAGRKTHPFIMALSYGATFISTSAIVGFGGAAGMYGMAMLWLTFFNIAVGIFVAFVFIAPATRRIGHALDAHTFPELMGRRFESKFIQVFSGLVIFLFMPLYASAVMIGASKYIQTEFTIPYGAALTIFTLIIASYVIVGGLKGVMYTDAMQGVIMFVGMVILIVSLYAQVGGVTEGHRTLTSIAALMPSTIKAIGAQGWTAMPKFGFGDKQYDLWWNIISSLTLGVGVGVLAQPQLIVRFMTVKSGREINRAVPTGGIFILAMTGVAFTVGAVSNAYFIQHGKPFTGRIVKPLSEEHKDQVALQLMKKNDAGIWVDVMKDDKGKQVPAIIPGQLNGTTLETATIDGKETPIVEATSISVVYAPKGDPEQIIPAFITAAMPRWFGVLFLLTLLSAAMSTVSSQFHVVGTSFGRDMYEQYTGGKTSIGVTRTGIMIGILVAVGIAYFAENLTFIARATAIFFGLCAASFLPAFVGGIFFTRMTRSAAIASTVAGFAASTFWIVLVKAKEAADIGLVFKVTGDPTKPSILWAHPNWPSVDPILIGLPVSIIVAILVSIVTKPSPAEHLSRCFPARASASAR